MRLPPSSGVKVNQGGTAWWRRKRSFHALLCWGCRRQGIFFVYGVRFAALLGIAGGNLAKSKPAKLSIWPNHRHR